MSKRLAVLIAATVVPALTFAGPAHARTQFPYRLIDLGTFGGPSSFVDLPGVPITRNGTVLGAADTPVLDKDWPHCGACSDRFIQHALAWRDGRRTDLGALPGNNTSGIYGLNAHGVGVGGSENGRTDPHVHGAASVAVLFKDGKVISLGTLPGGDESGAAGITNYGQVAGDSTNGTPNPFPFPVFFLPWGETRGFAWRNGVMRDLGTLGGADTLASAQNNRGQITGASYTSNTVNPSTGVPTIDPYLWQHGHMTDLGTLGGTLGFANWINNRGEVVGQSDLVGDQNAQPFLWQQGQRMKELPTIGGGYGFANWISPEGDISGSYLAPPHQKNFHGFLWRHGHMTDLPPVGGAPNAFGNAVNDHGQVVGNENNAKNNEELLAVLWSGGHGYDLNTLVAPSPLQMISADYITNHGDIFGHGVLRNGDQRIFLLIRNPGVPLPPAPAPARPLPCITGPPDRNISVILALHAAHRGPVSAPSARH